MLHRKLKDVALLDEIDRTLLRAVEAGLSGTALLESSTCDAEEAQLRILRLLHSGHLEGELGDTRTEPSTFCSRADARASTRAPTPATKAASAAPDASRDNPPSTPAQSLSGKKTVPPSARAARDALLRELATRASTSYPPPRASEPVAARAESPLPGYYSVRPGGPPSVGEGSGRPSLAPEPGRAANTSAAPGRYSVQGIPTPGAPSSLPPRRADDGFDSPLAALIHELSGGAELERWCAARLRAALHEELSGNVQQAISILQAVVVQLNDPRIRAERDRLQACSLKASSGIYRSRALLAERADKHKEAVESWRKVLEAFPDDAEATLHAARCSMEMGDLRQAGQHARRAAGARARQRGRAPPLAALLSQDRDGAERESRAVDPAQAGQS